MYILIFLWKVWAEWIWMDVSGIYWNTIRFVRHDCSVFVHANTWFFGRALHHCQFFAPNRLLGSKTKHATQSQYGAMGELEDCDTATQRDIPGNRKNMGRLQGTEFSLWPWHIEIVDLPIKMCFFLDCYAMFVYQSVMFMIIIVMIVMMMLIVIWVWVNTYRYIFSGMNIHLPAILGFTR